MTKLDELKHLKEKFNITINGLENYLEGEQNVLIANHNCLMDIFFLPMILPENIISLVSARLLYKNEIERKNMVEKYLYGMPIEAHGGKEYANMCLNYGEYFLNKGYSIGIFPEGAYVPDELIYRGRTGASRILYNSKEKGHNPNLIPVAIGIDKTKFDLDDYNITGNDVTINILKPIDYNEYYENYMSTCDMEIKNIMLHKPIDIGMENIANSLNKTYNNNYIELRIKGNVIYANGKTIPVDEAQKEEYIEQYKQELEDRKEKILKLI